MEKHRSTHLQEKVLRLRQDYLKNLPQTLEQARELMNTLSQGAGNEDLRADLCRCFHNIKGTSSSLGLNAIGKESAEALGLMRQLLHLSDLTRQEIIARLDSHLTKLETLTTHSQSAPPPTPKLDEKLTTHGKTVAHSGSLRGNIYLFDPDPDTGQLAGQLASFGYRIGTFATSDELRAAMQEEVPNAVVMTLEARNQVTDLQAKYPTPFLYLAERGDFQSRLQAVQSGGKAFFLKPVVAYEMIDVLDELTIQHDPEPYRVLILDDEPEMANYLGLILEAVGMESRRLHEPARILEVLAEFQPDLVLMDMYMSPCSGPELSALIRQMPQFLSVPIIFLSSETDKTIQLDAMLTGADGFLTKPVLPDDLVAAVTVRTKRTRTLRSLMMRDGLTGLFNHSTLSQLLETSLAVSNRHGGLLCFAMLDLDNFKGINDRYGHPAGDQVLVALARMLKQRLRKSDLIGRYGGEEFAIILHELSEDDAAQVLRGILKDFATISFRSDKGDFSCTFSCGVSGFPRMQSAEQLVHDADQALYCAKDGGRNQVVIAAEAADPTGEP